MYVKLCVLLIIGLIFTQVMSTGCMHKQFFSVMLIRLSAFPGRYAGIALCHRVLNSEGAKVTL